MKRSVLTLILLGSSLAVMAFAKNKKAVEPALTIENPVIMLPVPGSPVTGGFGVLQNHSAEPVKIKVKGVKPFKAVEIHATLEKEGMMVMEKLEELEIPAQSSLELKHGSYHIMLFDPERPLKVDEVLQLKVLMNGRTETFSFKVIQRH